MTFGVDTFRVRPTDVARHDVRAPNTELGHQLDAHVVELVKLLFVDRIRRWNEVNELTDLKIGHK